jgi:hypothetical protein
MHRKRKSFVASGSVTHQVLVTLLRIINFVGRRQLNFNLTEKSVYRHHQREIFTYLYE